MLLVGPNGNAFQIRNTMNDQMDQQSSSYKFWGLFSSRRLSLSLKDSIQTLSSIFARRPTNPKLTRPLVFQNDPGSRRGAHSDSGVVYLHVSFLSLSLRRSKAGTIHMSTAASLNLQKIAKLPPPTVTLASSMIKRSQLNDDNVQ